jgi:diacylglycerol kinase (ATP)
MNKIFVIQNPVAGTHSAIKVEKLIREKIETLGWDYELYQTMKDDTLSEVVIKARENGYQMFVVAGGDGTISTVASALACSEIPLLIIPAGTGNGLARDLNIPMRLEKAIDLIGQQNRIQKVDAIHVGGRFYLLNVSVGLSPNALRLTDREEKRRFGRMAYIFAGFKALLGIEPVRFDLTIDGEKYISQASELLLMNSVIIGSQKRFYELGIHPDDGKMDLFIIHSRTFGGYLRILGYLLLLKPQADPEVERFSVYHSLVINAQRSLQVQADGDLIGYTPVEIKVWPKAVEIIVPKE